MKILLLSPHPDDIELSCGGTLLKWLNQKNEFKWIVFSICEEAIPKGMPSNSLEEEFLGVVEDLNIENYEILKFKNRYFPNSRQEILDKLVSIKKSFNPNLVFCPSSFDYHQDHKVIYEECFRCFKRDASVLGYEHPWNRRDFSGAFFSRLTKELIEKKLSLLRHYKTQFTLNRSYFSDEFIKGLAKVRGVQCNADYAEAFEVIRWIE